MYKTAKYHGTKVELISSAKISTGFAEAPQSQKAMQADNVEEASPPSSLTVASGSQRCIACAGLIPRDWPLCFQHCRSGWPAMEGAASTWGKTKRACAQVVSRQMLFVGITSKSPQPSEVVYSTPKKKRKKSWCSSAYSK